MKDNSISVKDTFISEKDTSGVVTEVLRDAPHRKVKGLILRVGPPSFSSCVAENEKGNRNTRRRGFCSGYQRQKERLLQ